MICEPCAVAGDLTADPGPFPKAAHNLAAELHAECRGAAWCFCQHIVPTVAVLTERRHRNA